VAQGRRRQRRRDASREIGLSPSTVPGEASRVYQKDGRWYHIDLRKRGGGRPVLRDPVDPEGGARTDDYATAQKWGREYDRRWHAEQDEKRAASTGTYRRLDTAVTAFLKHRRVQKADSTAAGSRTALVHLMEAFGEGANPSAITSHELQLLLNEFLEADYAVNTVRGTCAHLKVFFDHIKVKPNPARLVELPKETVPDAKEWEEHETSRLREAADTLDNESGNDSRFYRRLVEFLLATGLRIQEAAGATYANINRKDRNIRVANQISRQTNEAADTKGIKSRLATILPEWWEYHDEQATGLVLPSENGGPIPYRRLYDYVVTVLTVAGLKETGKAAHQFRHTYAFLFLDRGGTLDELSKCLGHKSVKVTQRYYDHFTSDHAARSAASKFYPDDAPTIRRSPRKKKRK
jgi:integrase